MDSHAPDSKPEKQVAPSNIIEQTTPISSGLTTALPVIRRMGVNGLSQMTAHDVIMLQRTVGNQAVQRMLSEHALQRRVPDPAELPSAPTDVLHRHHILDFITIKLMGRYVDHWWIEIDDAESYGWWPVREPTSDGDAAWSHGIVGVPGELNAVSRPSLGGTPTRDPHHGDTAPETFHPFTVDRSDNLTNDVIRERIRAFARGFSGDYSILLGPNCHTFISDLMNSVGLSMFRTTGTDPILP